MPAPEQSVASRSGEPSRPAPSSCRTSTDPPPSGHPLRLNEVYRLVCELAEAREMEAPPVGRICQISIGNGWWADLSADAITDPAETMLGPYALRLRRGGLSYYLGPFTPLRWAAADLGSELRAAILLAKLSRSLHVSEDTLRAAADGIASARLGQALRDNRSPQLAELGLIALILQGDL